MRLPSTVVGSGYKQREVAPSGRVHLPSFHQGFSIPSMGVGCRQSLHVPTSYAEHGTMFQRTGGFAARCVVDRLDDQIRAAAVDPDPSPRHLLFALKHLMRCFACSQIFSGNSGKVADFSIAPPQYDTLTSLLAERRESVLARKHL